MSIYPFGIYLGPNDCSIAIWENGRVVIIQNDAGKDTTPSVVSFTKTHILVGEVAKNHIKDNPKNIIYGIREIIGKKFDNPDVQKFINKVPFKIEKDSKTGKPNIIVEYKGETKRFIPEEIYAIIIGELISYARNYIGMDIKDAIITVPSYYNVSQREAIRDAGRIAGVNILRIVNEETAVCYAYRFDKEKKNKNILVFNMRSSETNVTIVNLKDSISKIKGTVRDDNLRGNSFNEELIKYCINEFKKETGIIIQKDSKPYRRLKKPCEECI